MAGTANAGFKGATASITSSMHGTDSRPGTSQSPFTFQQTVKTTSADVKEAERHRDLDSIRNLEGGEPTKPSFLRMTPQDLGKYGVGLELYFSFLKRASILFSLVSAISVWPLLLNWTGGYLKGIENISVFDNLTLANQDGKDFSSDDLESANDSIDDNRKHQIMTLAADVAYTILFIAFLVYFKVKSAVAIRRNFEQNLLPSKFAVEVKGLPSDAKELEVTDHFRQFGEVVETSLARNYKGTLLLYEERSELSIELEIQKKISQERGEITNEKIVDLEARIQKFDIAIAKKNELCELPHDELPVTRAYIVFDRSEDKENCYQQFRRARRFCQSRKKQPPHLQFQGKYPLKVKQPPEPSNILWENLEVKSCSRRLRKLLALVCTLALMILSVALLYTLKSFDSGLPVKYECTVESDQDLSLEEAEVQYTEDDQIECWCLLEGITAVLQSSKKRAFCKEYISLWQLSTSIRVLSAAGIILINFMLKLFLRKITRSERMSTVTKEQKKIMFKIFLAMFVNTAFISLVVNADFQDFVAMQYVPFKKYMFDGEFDDFTRGWYMRVGSAIVITMLISMVSPHFLNLFVRHPYKKCKRCCCKKRQKTQYELNKLYTGAEYDIAGKTAIALNIIFSCFLYSGGIPLLNVICFCSLFFLYWIEKYLIVNYYRKPPVYDHGLNQQVMSLLKYSILLHCGFSLYMYGSETIWPLEYEQDAEGFIATVEVSFIERLSRFTSLALMAIMVLTCLAMIATYLIVGIGRLSRSTQVMPNNETPLTYRNGLGEMQHRGVASYIIHENPRYSHVVVALNQCSVSRPTTSAASNRRVRPEVSITAYPDNQAEVSSTKQ